MKQLFLFLTFFLIISELSAQDRLVLVNSSEGVVKKFKPGHFIHLKLQDTRLPNDTLAVTFVEGYIDSIFSDHIVLFHYSIIKQYYKALEDTQIHSLHTNYSSEGELSLPIAKIAAIHRKPRSNSYMFGLDLLSLGLISAGFFQSNDAFIYIGAPILLGSILTPLLTKDRLLIIQEGKLDYLFGYHVKSGYRLEVRSK